MSAQDSGNRPQRRYSRRDFGKLAAAVGATTAGLAPWPGHALQSPVRFLPSIAAPVATTFQTRLSALASHPDRFAWSDNYADALNGVRTFMTGLETTNDLGAPIAAYQEVENAFQVADGNSIKENGDQKALTVESRNVMFSLSDRDHASPNKIYLICAHLDTTQGSPGANDNGSGVAAVLTLAEAFKDFKPEVEGKGKSTIRFALFGAEESGLLGSAAFARYLMSLSPSSNVRHHVINLDMIAGRKLNPRRPDFRIEYAEYPNSRPMADALEKKLEGAPYNFDVVTDNILDKPTPKDIQAGKAPSDHRSFLRKGFYAVSLSQDQPYFPIHTPQDKYEDEGNPYVIDTGRAMQAIGAIHSYLTDELIRNEP